jgi:hypothetical protein
MQVACQQTNKPKYKNANLVAHATKVVGIVQQWLPVVKKLTYAFGRFQPAHSNSLSISFF